MNLVEDKRVSGFTFTWTIHSYCVHRESEYIDSPKFEVEFPGVATKLYLRLYPKGDCAPGFISYYLRKVYDDSSNIKFALSIRLSNGLFKKEVGKKFYSGIIEGYKSFLSLDELKGPDGYLDNDTLTLRCRILTDDADLSSSVRCFVHTKIKVTKFDYMWIISNFEDSPSKYSFNQTSEIKPISTDIPCFKIQLLNAGTYDDNTIYFAVEQVVRSNNLLFKCKVHLLDAEGKVAHSVRGEYLFKKSHETQIWTLPFLSKRKLLFKEKVYLPGGKLSLRCEFAVSTSGADSEVERLEYDITEDLQLNAPIQQQVPDLPDPWKENMKRFYNDETFCDSTIRTPSKQFPVLKAILCAQSEVFGAMFDSDMKENRTGVVEIDDLEDDTVSNMLQFIYTGTLDDLDCSMACNLYFAADKYRITALQKKCSNFLMNSLDTSNVCDALVLAETHNDQPLKSIARDFIFSHAHEIMNSEEWNKLMEANDNLFHEITLLICKNFKDDLKP